MLKRSVTVLTMFCVLTPAVTSFATTLVLVLSIGGTLPSGTKIGGIDATVTIPAGITVQADPLTGMVASPVLMPSGQWEAGAIFLAGYVPASGTLPGSVRVGLINPVGLEAGEFAELTCEVIHGSFPDASPFPISGVIVTDISGAAIPGLIADVALGSPKPVDTTPPITTASLPTGTYSTAQIVTLSANEPANIYYTTDGSDPVTSTTKKLYIGPLTIEATTILMFYAMDTAGNCETVTSKTYTLDITPPLVSAGGDRTASAIFTQNGAATDASSMTYVWSAVSGPGLVTFGSAAALTTTIAANTSGTYLIRLTATDAGGNSASSDMTLTWVNPPSSLTVSVSGTGGGGVTSVPSVIVCPGAHCAAAFAPGSTVTLTAFPDGISTFAKWTGACSGSINICTMVMDGAKSVTATFDAAPPVMGGAAPYLKLQDAFSLMTGGGTVRALAIKFTENLILNGNVAFIFKGGYDGGYTSNMGWTTVRGTLTIVSGSLTVDKVEIR